MDRPAGRFPRVVRRARPERALVGDDPRIPADLLRALGMAEMFRLHTDEGALMLVYVRVTEEQFLELLVVGLSYKQIADRLAVSIDSTRKHLQSIYRKLHINSRSEATFHWLSRRRAGASSNYIKM